MRFWGGPTGYPKAKYPIQWGQAPNGGGPHYSPLTCVLGYLTVGFVIKVVDHAKAGKQTVATVWRRKGGKGGSRQSRSDVGMQHRFCRRTL